MKFFGAAWRIGIQLVVLGFAYAVMQVPKTPFETIVVGALVLLFATISLLQLWWAKHARDADVDNRLRLHELWTMAYEGDPNDKESCDRGDELIELQKAVIRRNRYDETASAFALITVVYANYKIIASLI